MPTDSRSRLSGTVCGSAGWRRRRSICDSTPPRLVACVHSSVAAATELWTHATSLGGVESQIERRRRHPAEPQTVPDNLLRLSVGIEDVEDLWHDLDQALRG